MLFLRRPASTDNFSLNFNTTILLKHALIKQCGNIQWQKIVVKLISMTTSEQILTSFPELCSEVLGPRNCSFSTISALENIKPQSLIYVLQDKYFAQAIASSANIVLAPVKLKTKISGTLNQCWILSPNPELLMALIKNKFVQTTPYRSSLQGIHSTAIVDSSSEISATASIGPNACIGKNVKIGDNSFVGANSVVEENSVIGNNSTIHPLVYIGHSCVIGHFCEVMPQSTIGSEGFGYAHDAKGNHYRIPHTGRVILQDHVHIGANTAIDRGSIEDTIIGQGTKIDNQCHLAHNSVIGQRSLLTAQFGMAGSSTIGDNFVCGGKTSVTGHIQITDNVQVAGMSGVTKSIEKAGSYGGFPLQPLQDYLKTKAAMANLHELRLQIKNFLKGEKP